MRTRCTHVAVLSEDVEASVEFYQRFARLLEVHRRVDGGVTVVWMGEPDAAERFVIVIIGAPHAEAIEPAPMAHLGYAVGSREDVDEVVADARAEGCLVEGPIEGGDIVGYYCILRDPSGNKVEFSFGQSLGADIEDH